jgi:DNA helicase-2/ATP-dependent DNA helicase PcrA
MTLIRRMPKSFGCVGTHIIDRDDQLQLFKQLRSESVGKDMGDNKKNKKNKKNKEDEDIELSKEAEALQNLLPKPADLCDIYSFARNTRSSLSKTLEFKYKESLPVKDKIAEIIRAYEEKKNKINYLDYDDILDVVATVIKSDERVRKYIALQYDHLLVDEMQDTNPLQWELLQPLCNNLSLFCVGDDAQSIYGFRGADYRNVHSFSERVPDSTVLKLEKNYRSTQEILDISNWLLKSSPIDYNKTLSSIRGTGSKPQLIDFANEYDEARWITSDLTKRHNNGAEWSDHMILTRSGYAAQAIESNLLSKNIPYVFIGGTKLLESAHVRDILSLLKIISNPSDELSWMRYLTLWPKVGDMTATDVVKQFPEKPNLSDCINIICSNGKLPANCKLAFTNAADLVGNLHESFLSAQESLLPILAHNYKDDWDNRKGDFELVDKLIQNHTSLSEFMDDYLLDQVSSASLKRKEDDDVVTLITVHSAKGTEKQVCYVIHASPGTYPSKLSIGSEDEVEEERRVLYVALTRAQNELIITRRNYVTHGYNQDDLKMEKAIQGYFFNQLESELVEFKAPVHVQNQWKRNDQPILRNRPSLNIDYS